MKNWPVPKFAYGDHVILKPVSSPLMGEVAARVIDLHFFGALSTVEYDVRYFHEGKDFKVRVFEDELLPA